MDIGLVVELPVEVDAGILVVVVVAAAVECRLELDYYTHYYMPHRVQTLVLRDSQIQEVVHCM